MADTKISALSAGTAAPGDEIPVNRGGSNFKITAGDILKINGGTITADSPVLNLTQTWNDAAVTFTGLKFNADGSSSTNSASGSLLMDLQVGGSSKLSVTKAGALNVFGSSIRYGASSEGYLNVEGTTVSRCVPGSNYFAFAVNLALTGNVFSAPDVILARDAAGILAQRNGNNTQTFCLYGRYTDATNDFERFHITASSTAGAAVQLGTQKGAVAGTARALELQTNGTTRLTLEATGYAIRHLSSYWTSDANAFVLGSGTGTVRALVARSDFALIDTSALFGWGDLSSFSSDLRLYRDAAGILAQRQGANAQESRIYGSYTSATNYQRTSIKTVRESSGALSGASYTTTIAVPAYANLIGVTTRVTTDITGATTYDVGDGSDVDLWGAAIGITAGSASRTADFTAVGAVGAAAASRTITLTANGSNFTGGEVEICAHYLFTEAD